MRVKAEQSLASFTCLHKAFIPTTAAALSHPFLPLGLLAEVVPEGGSEGKSSEKDCVAATFIFGTGEQTQQEWEQGITDLRWQHVEDWRQSSQPRQG